MTTTNLGRVAIVPKGTYTAGSHKPLDLVRYNGSSYIAKTTTTELPTVTSDWDLVAGDGASLYTWIKYADDSIGTGLSDSPANKIFIGIAVNKTSATESTVATDYTWSQIKGNDGSPTYTWIKYADDASGTGLSNTSAGKSYIGIAVNKTSTTESTTASDYEWTLIKGEKGDTGTNGTNGTGTVNSITAGTGLSGGVITDTGTIALADTAVTPASYTNANITVDAQGRITAAANGTAGSNGTVTSVAMTVPSFLSIAGSPITSSGTLAVTLSGTALPIANGGTGATTLAGANLPVTNVANTFTGTQTFNGTSTTLAAVFANAAETTTVSATAATGTILFYSSAQCILYYTTAASANWVMNLTHAAGTTLNSVMAVGQTVTVAFFVTNGATAYYNTSVQVDGSTDGVTVRWQGGIAPTSGDASAVDIYTYAIVKTGNATFSVFAAVSKFA